MTGASWLATLAATLEGRLVLPGSDGYRAATTPRNLISHQGPIAVAVVAGTGDVSACVRAAAAAGVSVSVQATGHGAAADLDATTLLLDTSGLDTVQVDPSTRTARAGAGTRFGALNSSAWPYGLLGLGGTAPDVGVAGYTFSGGVGWLTRPHGLASASLLAVDWVDGEGIVRRADERQDPDALWAFRGGGGVGIATSVELSLVPAADLWAGHLLWPAGALEAVSTAWAAATTELSPLLSTSLGLLHLPDRPDLPEQLRGRPAVHLCAASVAGPSAGRVLQRVLDGLPAAVVDTRGPCDAVRLSQIHLDPPVPVPALGIGRWLDDRLLEHAYEILAAAGTGDDTPLPEVELRHLPAPVPSAPPGAMTVCPGSFLLHATGPAAGAQDRQQTYEGLSCVRAAATAADTGLSASAFCDGQPVVPDCFDIATQERLTALRDGRDPHAVVRPARALCRDLDQ